VCGGSSLESRDVDLGEAECPHLARRHETGHRADRLLDRHLRIDPVKVVEVDRLDAEAAKRRLACLADVVGAAVQMHLVGGRVVDDDAALRRQHDVVAASRDRPADELLVRERPVHVGGVEERDAELERSVDDRDRLGFVAPAVAPGHAHAAESDRRHLE
jgi:hypothetical protein